ncbi:unnamed protein product [Trichobilharzia regenti]|nr:unnamed protein product [Trichobilharzia regenti]
MFRLSSLTSIIRRQSSQQARRRNVAMILHGCGVYDGTEIHEATRNVLIESARIARGNVHSLDDLNASNFDALFIPGGFGVAKNLSNFASENASCALLAKLEDIVKKFHSDGKPMG